MARPEQSATDGPALGRRRHRRSLVGWHGLPGFGPLHWCSYFKPGTGPGPQNGYWINFGCAYSHLAHDDPAQLLTGAAQRLYYDSATAQWMLVIQATDYITNAVRDVWTGSKAGGPDPVGPYTRVTGCDPLATVTVAAG